MIEERDQWIEDERLARKSPNYNSSKHPLDLILYEIGYINYLLGSYKEARKLFSESVDVSLILIERGMQSEPNTYEWNNGVRSFANIWSEAILEQDAKIREILHNALSSGHLLDNDQAEIDQIIKKSISIYNKLSVANHAANEESSSLYLDAIRAIRPEWHSSINRRLLSRSSEIESDLMRNEMNTYCNANEVLCWPVLFGLSDKIIPTEIPLPIEYKRLSSLSQHGILLQRRYVEFLYQWTNGVKSDKLEDKIVSTAALMRADGGFQSLGDLVLLAWRCVSSDEMAEALAWYLEHQVPNIGNDLPKKALRHLTNIGQRVLCANNSIIA